MTVTIWLELRGRKYMFALLPAVFMLATTTAALIYLLLTDYWPHHNLTLIVTDVMLLGLSLGVAVLVAKTFLRVLRHPQPQVAPVPASVKT